MILELVKRDRAWKTGLFIAPLVVMPLLVDRLVPFGPDPQLNQLLGVQFLLLAGFMSPHRRATLFEAALPIEGRQLFLARLLSRLAMVWLPVLVATLAISAGRGADQPQVLAMLESGALFTLAYLLPLSVRVRECAAPASVLAALWAALAAAGALAWHFLPPGIFLSVVAIATALIVLRTWFALPACFQVAPIEAVDAIASVRSKEDARPVAWWPIVRSAVPLIALPAAGFLAWSAEAFAPFVAVFAITANMDVRRRSRWLYGLPLSFRALGLIILVPSLALLFGGMAIGMCFDKTAQSDYSLYGGPKRQPPSDLDIPVDFEFWHRASSGTAPVISAPWGESVHATTFRVLGITFFNPYSVDSRNSERFFKWQFERATAAVYGRAIPIMQYGAASRAGLVPITARPRMRILKLSTAMLGVLLLVYMGEWSRSYRVRSLPDSAREALPFVPLLTFFAIVLSVDLNYSFSLGTALVHAALLRVSDYSLLVVTAVAVVPVVGMYWLLEKQFSQSEMVGPIRQYSAWGRLKQAE